jgi:hypothetical protein
VYVFIADPHALNSRPDPAVLRMRSRYRRLLADPAELDARLAKGEQRACRRADRTLARTVDAMGL